MTTAALIFWLIVPLLVLIAVIDLATMSQPRHVQLLRRAGMSQRTIAQRLGITRYAVRLALA
jgi:transcriptional regulator